MKITLVFTSIVRKILTLVMLSTLAACGGGGGGTDTTTTVVTPTVLTLQSSAGDLSKYTNSTWVSDCGTVLKIGGGQQTYQRNIFKFGAATSTTVNGSVSTSVYTGVDCTGSTVAGSGSVVLVSFKYIKDLAVTSASPATAQGKADEFLITETASKATQTFTVGFLPDFQKFAGGASSFFSSISLRYNKL
jgi:hypothetical protein